MRMRKAERNEMKEGRTVGGKEGKGKCIAKNLRAKTILKKEGD